jgi:hypothetical protein
MMVVPISKRIPAINEVITVTTQLFNAVRLFWPQQYLLHRLSPEVSGICWVMTTSVFLLPGEAAFLAAPLICK